MKTSAAVSKGENMTDTKRGYGIVYTDIMRSDLSIYAKAVYAYLASRSDTKGVSYPSRATIIKDLRIGKNNFTSAINDLKKRGIVTVKQNRNNNRFGNNIYILQCPSIQCTEIQDAEIQDTVERDTEETAKSGRNPVNKENLQCPPIQCTETQCTEIQDTVQRDSNINNIYNINKNSINTISEIVDHFNNICRSYPKVTKLSNRRKKTIRARLNSGYTVDDFKKVFEIAEGNAFLKGCNDRNWKATFDWLTQDSNMAKVIDGNYSNSREQGKDILNNGTSTKDTSVYLW